MNWISKKITLYIERGKSHKKKKNINSFLMRNSLFCCTRIYIKLYMQYSK